CNRNSGVQIQNSVYSVQGNSRIPPEGKSDFQCAVCRAILEFHRKEILEFPPLSVQCAGGVPPPLGMPPQTKCVSRTSTNRGTKILSGKILDHTPNTELGGNF